MRYAHYNRFSAPRNRFGKIPHLCHIFAGSRKQKAAPKGGDRQKIQFCAASVGALLAGVFGYSGAYLVMTITGVIVFILINIYGMDVIQIAVVVTV